jgi:eukaryotic-like serine/threonine-protein kinase
MHKEKRGEMASSAQDALGSNGGEGSPQFGFSSSTPRTPEAGPGPARPLPAIPDHTLIKRIGGGSYGEVWLARNLMGTYRAVKIIYRSTFGQDRPFEREYRGLCKFEPVSRTHEGLVDALHVGRNEELGCFYYVMELADDAGEQKLADRGAEVGSQKSQGDEPGCDLRPLTPAALDPATYSSKTLHSELRRCGRLPFAECLRLGLLLTEAVGHLHQHGLTHRDIKPSNIIFVHGVPKLADIGLVTDAADPKSFVGTEGFIPPEGAGTPQADLYSLGKVLYEISTGKDRQEFPDPRSSLGADEQEPGLREFNEVVLRACQPDPYKRYQTAAQMHDELLLVKGGKSVRHLRKVEQRLAAATRVLLLALGVTALAVGGYFWAAHQTRHAKQHAREAEKQQRRAERAEGQTREALREACLAQARANRQTRQSGRRFDSLAAIAKAAAIRPSLDLRNEAIACLALPDLRLGRQWMCPTGQADLTQYFAFDSGFERYARCDERGDVSVRRVLDDVEVARLPSPGTRVEWLLRFSPDDRLLAVRHAGKPSLFRVWDWEDRRILLQLTNVLDHWAADFDPESGAIALGRADNSVVIYDLNSERPRRAIPLPDKAQELRFDPTGRRLAACSRNMGVVLFDRRDGQSVGTLVHPSGVLDMAWHPDGERLAAACADYRVYLWNVSTARLETVLSGHQAEVTRVMFTHEGDLLASGSWDGTLRLWDPWSGTELINLPGGSQQFSRDDHWLGYIWDRRRLGFFELACGRECRVLHSDFRASAKGPSWVEFSPDGRCLAVAHADGIRLWDARTARQIAFLPSLECASVLFYPDGHRLVAGTRYCVEEWPLQTDASGYALRLGPPEVLLGKSSQGWLAMDREGRYLAIPRQHKVDVLDLTNPRQRVSLSPSSNVVWVSVSPDGERVAAGNWHGSGVRVFRRATAALERELPAPESARPGFSPDGKWLVVSHGREFQVYRTASWKVVQTIPRDNRSDLPGHFCFSRDGRILALAHANSLIKLVEPETARDLATLEPLSPQMITGLAFNPDGSQLAVACSTHVIQLWDLRAIRSQLAAMNLDWNAPSLPPALPAPAGELKVTVLARTNKPEPLPARP